jgi:uncharacterized protein YegL
MTDSNKTEVIMIVDRSGSMYRIWEDTVGGFKNFIKDQRSLPGKTNITLVTFDDSFDTIYNGADISDCNDDILKEYGPRGSTALLDTMGYTINSVGERFAKMDESERPCNVVVCVITDGQENASKEFVIGSIKEMVEHQTSKYNWKFIYLGANQDSFSVGGSLGFTKSGCANYAYSGVGAATGMRTLSRSIDSIRATGSMSDVQSTYDSLIDSKE